MFTQKLFSHALTQTFGSKEQKAAQTRENVFGMIEFAFFHAVRHGNSTPWGELLKATSTGGGMRKSVRECIAGIVPPRREIPKDKAALAKFEKVVTDDAKAFATEALAAIEANYADAIEAKEAKREAKKAEKEAAEETATAQRDAALKAALEATQVIDGPTLVMPEGQPVKLSADEAEMLFEFLASLRAKEVAPDTPEPLKVAA